MRDFRMQQQVPMASIIQAYQQRTQQEMQMKQQAQQQQQQKFQQIQQVIQMASGLIQQGMDYSAQRKQQQNNQNLVSLIQSSTDMIPGGQPGTAKLMSGQTVPTMESIPRSQDPAYRAELLAAYTKADPKAGAQMAMQQMMPQPEKEKWTLKQAVINGKPEMVKADSQGNMFFRDGTPVPTDARVEPFSQFTAAVDITDEDRKKYKNLAQAVIEGRAMPSQVASMRTAAGQKLALVVSELDPTFNVDDYGNRVRLRREFMSGRRGQEAKALDTMILHADKLIDASEAMQKSNVRKYNTIKNWIKREGEGNPELVRTAMLARGTSRETLRILQGVGVITQEEARNMENDLDINAAPDEFMGAVEAMFTLAGGRLITLRSDWEHTMGNASPPVPLMNERSISILKRRGFDPETMEKMSQPSGGMTPQQRARLDELRKKAAAGTLR